MKLAAGSVRCVFRGNLRNSSKNILLEKLWATALAHIRTQTSTEKFLLLLLLELLFIEIENPLCTVVTKKAVTVI